VHGSSSHEKSRGSRAKAGGGQRGRSAQRLKTLQEMVGILMDVALRGRLLPSERTVFKRFRQEQKKEQRVVQVQQQVLRCPACRSPLPDPGAERCPFCSLLLKEMFREVRQGLARAGKRGD
jgi:hypothetical protein